MDTRRLFTLLLVLLLQAVSAQDDGPVVGPTAPEGERSIVVVGRGVAFGRPDTATVTVGVTVSDEDVRQAVSRVDEGIAGVMEALAALGVPERSIRTTSFDVWREEHYPQRDDQSARTTFRAQHMLAVEVAGAGRAGEVLAAAVEAGANAVGGISFGFADTGELERIAREAAVSDARERAEQLASAAGVTLGAPLTVEELSRDQGPIQPFLERSTAMMSDLAVAESELSVEIRVWVRYRIE